MWLGEQRLWYPVATLYFFIFLTRVRNEDRPSDLWSAGLERNIPADSPVVFEWSVHTGRVRFSFSHVYSCTSKHIMNRLLTWCWLRTYSTLPNNEFEIFLFFLSWRSMHLDWVGWVICWFIDWWWMASCCRLIDDGFWCAVMLLHMHACIS